MQRLYDYDHNGSLKSSLYLKIAYVIIKKTCDAYVIIKKTWSLCNYKKTCEDDVIIKKTCEADVMNS
jgi:hypothetical protein